MTSQASQTLWFCSQIEKRIEPFGLWHWLMSSAVFAGIQLNAIKHHFTINAGTTIYTGQLVGQKKKENCCCPQVEFLNIWVGVSEFFYFFILFFYFNYFFLYKASKSTKVGCIFHLFFFFFFFFFKNDDKTPNVTKIGCIPDPNFFKFYLWRWASRWRQQNILFSWPN